MKTASHIGAAMFAWLGAVSSSAAQDITWKQTINFAKYQSIPRGSGDILGIELGDTYADAKMKLQGLLAEGLAPRQPPKDALDRVTAEMDGQTFTPPIKEERRVFRMQVPGASNVVTASFIAKVTLTRDLKGSTARAINETIQVYLSAPSSGHQVIGIERYVSYNAEEDQPRVSELLPQLKKKMQSEPQIFPTQSGATYRFQYNDGRPYAPAKPTVISCQTSFLALLDSNAVKSINQQGDCDALLDVRVNFGISRDHASSLSFGLSDNDRMKMNLAADSAYVSNHIRGLQERTRGAAPKL